MKQLLTPNFWIALYIVTQYFFFKINAVLFNFLFIKESYKYITVPLKNMKHHNGFQVDYESAY